MNEQVNISPPGLPLKFLRWFCNEALVEDVEGDISELFFRRVEKNKKRARILFALDVLFLFRPGIIKNFEITKGLINTAMIRNYIKVALRNAHRYKGFTALNLMGLIVGIVSSILILLWVNDEVRMDKFHQNGDNIYQLFRNMRQTGGIVNTTFAIPKPAADLMEAEYPEVGSVALLSWEMEYLLGQGKSVSKETGRVASQEFLNMFSFEFISGNKSEALKEMMSIAISERLAEKHFGSDWKGKAIGSTLRIDDQYDLTVSGVFETPGDNSSLKFDWLATAEAFISQNDWVNDWGNGSFNVYFSLENDEDLSKVADRVLNEIIVHAAGQSNSGDEQLVIHRFQDYYLYSNWDNGVIIGGRIDYVRIMSVVAIFILIIACINFMNLATARSDRRSKEIGLRKVMGANKKSISFQFYFEAFLLTTISVILSVGVVLLVLPFFNALVDKSLYMDFSMPLTWYFLVGIILLVGLLSGSYPALLLPALNIIQSLKGTVRQSSLASYFRKGLVVFQFAISTLLIIGMAVIYKQLDYVLNKDLGVDKENLVAVRMEGNLSDKLETYKNELMKIPEVIAITGASGNPINYGRSTSSASWEGKNPDDGYEINILLTDEDIIETMGMEIVKGRGFSDQFADSTNFIINEVAAELMGFEYPLDKDLSFWGIDGKIIGVVKNFHMRDLYNPIAPLIISCIAPSRSSIVLIRLKGNTSVALKGIRKVTDELNPGHDFDYQFVDEAYAESYQSEKTSQLLSSIFAVISVFISCLGLFGLSAFTAERRSREIGVRKVHGASVTQILVLLSKDYSRLMIMAFILAIPFGYYFMQNWLNDFEFRISMDPMIFIVSGFITLIIGIATVTAKSYHAATLNPVNSLKDE
ncbi:MAG: FtsX-like permease family protein [Cyclobacteriaceae bacterium]